MELTDAGLLDTTGSSKAVGNIRTNDTALAEKEIDTCKASSERTLVDTGVVGSRAEKQYTFRFKTDRVVYILESEHYVKIGRTDNILQRISEHRSNAAKVYGDFRIVGWLEGGDREEILKQIPIWDHKAHGMYGNGEAKDWFMRGKFVDRYIKSLVLRHPEELGFSTEIGAPVMALRNPKMQAVD